MSTRNLTQRAFPLLRLSRRHWREFVQVAWYNESKRTAEYVKPHKRKGLVERHRHFVDYVKVTVRGGSGGNGMMSFSSLPNLEWAGPDGGSGGNGGHVVFKVSHNTKSLAHVNPIIAAPKGVNGRTRQRDGKNAPHLIVQVPFGTVIKSEEGRVLASLDDADSMFIAARGGAGGKGNYFYLSNENRAPVMAEKGGLGQERQLHVELKTMAHAGLIGFPNAGKSSLLRAISRAQPKVSPYPFTTLNPHIGMVLYDDYQQLAVADIPGLIPGSHLNRGMGHSFLRHIERCLCLVYVIDLSLDRPWEQLEQLKYELNQYRDGLAERPALLVANKMDLPEARDRLEGLKLWVKNEMRRKNKNKRAGSENENANVNGVTEESEVDVNQKKEDFFFRGSSRLGNNDNNSERLVNAFENNENNSERLVNAFENNENNSVRIDNVVEDRNLDSVCNSTSRIKGSRSNEVSERGAVKNIKDDTGFCKNADNIWEDGGRKFEKEFDEVEADCGTSHKTNGILVLAVSAKREIGIGAFLHHLRVIYDSHLSSKNDGDIR